MNKTQFFLFFTFLIAHVACFNGVFAEDKELGAIPVPKKNDPSKKMPKKEPLTCQWGMMHVRNQIKFKPESFYLKYAYTLNNKNTLDKIILSRSTIDYNVDILYGKEWYGYDAYEFFLSFRNKGTWGNPESIAQTSETNLKLLDAVFGEHKHYITRHVLWIREMWFKFCINDALGLNFANKHYFTMGAFPFELGRGISLGSAFAVGQRALGFYSDTAVDQYAFGFKFSGDVFPRYLTYDLYGSILQNKSDSLTRTAAKVRGQEFGRKFFQERGSGVVDFIVAGRMRWFPFNKPGLTASIEPYVMYNYAPEQHVEFVADANSKLGTLGLAGEFIIANFEGGFDAALNVGRQVVPGWDRNIVEFYNNDGTVTLVNSRIHNTSASGPKAVYVPGSATQEIVDTSAQSAAMNGQQIGTVGGVPLFNDINRFRNPSVNQYKGWMVVADAAYNLTICKNKIKLAATVGAASGGHNPNHDIHAPGESGIDRDFKGFIGLEELYSGYRVQSAFLLGGMGKAPRPLLIPTSSSVVDRLPSLISGFTNLIFVGSGLHWYPRYNDRSFTIRPNIIAYWQEHATNAFDLATGKSSHRLASNYLGVEVNAFTDAQLFEECKLYVIGSVFFPGKHYSDIKGTPLSKEELKIIDRYNKTGVIDDANPLLGDDTAFTLNIGIECRF